MATILQNHYVLAVHDLEGSAKFFVDTLGFEVMSEPTGWVFIRKDNCLIMMGECPDDLPPGETGSHNYFGYLVVDDADEYFAEIEAKGGNILSAIDDKPWGMREFGVRTPEGHRIMIGHRLEGA